LISLRFAAFWFLFFFVSFSSVVFLAGVLLLNRSDLVRFKIRVRFRVKVSLGLGLVLGLGLG
jgi:hypothetical protein